MRRVLDFLGSARLAILLFFILAGLSIFGTFIPQGRPPEFYLQKYGPSLGKFINLFGLSDSYHSFWYLFALFLFVLNLIICTLNRLPLTLQLYRRDPEKISPEKIPAKKVFPLKNNPASLRERLLQELRFKEVSPNFFVRSKNRWAFFAFVGVHLSLIVIVLGALLDGLFGFIGNISILENSTSNIVQPFRKQEPHILPFTLKLDKFILETYPNGMPKEYISHLTVIDGPQRFQTTVKVNSPFSYKGYKFYQASYQVLPDFKIQASYDGDTEELIVSPLIPAIFKDRFQIGIIRFSEAHGYLFVNIWVFDEKLKREAKGILIKGVPHFQLPVEEGKYLKIDLLDVAGTSIMTGLQVKKAVATPLVYLGFILICLFVLLVYYFEPKALWVFLDEETSKVIIGCYRKRYRQQIEEEIVEIFQKIST